MQTCLRIDVCGMCHGGLGSLVARDSHGSYYLSRSGHSQGYAADNTADPLPTNDGLAKGSYTANLEVWANLWELHIRHHTMCKPWAAVGMLKHLRRIEIDAGFTLVPKYDQVFKSCVRHFLFSGDKGGFLSIAHPWT